jgi:transcriptional regulator with XRE-family HTH domain
MDTVIPQDDLIRNDTLADSIQRFLMEIEDGHILSGRQCRAARAMLRWQVRETAKRAGIGPGTLMRVERDSTDPKPNPASLAALRLAFQRAGVVFIGKDGVRLPIEGDDED